MTDNERILQSYKSMRSNYERIPWDRNSINARFFNQNNMNYLDKQIERYTDLVIQEKIEKTIENIDFTISFDNQKITDAIIKSITGSGNGGRQ